MFYFGSFKTLAAETENLQSADAHINVEKRTQKKNKLFLQLFKIKSMVCKVRHQKSTSDIYLFFLL